MKRKLLITICLVLIILLDILSIKSNAENAVNIKLSKTEIEVGEDFYLNIGNSNTSAAAGTIWIYFDNEKLECLTKMDNINIIGNRIIYTWISEDGQNKKLENLLNLNFKSKNTGIASFTIIGEIYDENGNEINMNQTTTEIEISEKNKEAKTAKTSDNANSLDLKVMRLDKEGIVPNFNPNITEYYIIVDENTDNIKVTATPENSGSNVKISGNENLKDGLNKITITVKNGSESKKYIINVTKTDQKEKANTNLETLAIENYEITPEYKENITEYNLQISNTEEKLNILAIPENMKAKVEIKNNENLKYGENIIEILVTAQNGITQKVYKLNVYKRNEEEEKEYDENKQQTINESKNIIEKINSTGEDSFLDENEQEIKEENEKKELEDKIIMWVGIILSIIVVILLIIRIRKDKNVNHF